MNNCLVCGQETNKCTPSPFLPYSGWRCEECQKSHRIPYDEFREWWKGSDGAGPDNGVEYAEKYWLPTLEFFNKIGDLRILETLAGSTR